MRLLEIGLLLLLAGCAATGDKKVSSTPARLSSEGQTNIGLAQSYLDQNKLAQATERASRALATDPNSADVHALWARIHTRNKDYDKAAREFDRALKLAPGNGSILNAHASWLCERGQFDLADTEFVLALRDARYRTPVQALANAGRCAHKAGKWSLAEGYLRRALEIAPSDRRVLLLLADSELQQGKIMEAQAFVQRSDALGADAPTLELAARIEDAAGNQLAAARYRQRLQDEFPNRLPTGEGARSP